MSRRPLVDSEAIFRGLFEFTDSAAFVCRFDDHQIIEVNRAMQELFGQSVSELRDRAFVDLLVGMNEQRIDALCEAMRATGGVTVDQLELRRAEDTFIARVQLNLFTATNTMLVVGTIEDLTLKLEREGQLREASQRVRASEAIYRGLVESMKDAVIISDLESAQIIEANPAASQLFGYANEEWNDLTMRSLHPKDYSYVVEVLEKRLRDTGNTHLREAHVIKNDGTVFFADLILTVFEAAGRKLVVSVMTDVSDRRRQDEQLESSYQQLRQAQAKVVHSQKLAAVGEVAAGVAHEINNPAAFVSMNLEEMQREVDKIERVFESLRRHLTREDDQERRRLLTEQIAGHESSLRGLRAMLNDNRDGIDRIRSVTRDLRMFSRVEQGEVVDIDLNAVVRSAVNLLSNELRHRARIKIELGELPSLAAERGKLGQVVTNLLLNAAQAIVEGAADSNLISIRTRQDGDHVILAVEDTGAGMDEEVSSRIFDPFFTTKPREQGTGLGLSLCAEIVSKHRGQLSVESTPGKGSVFEIRLPTDTGLVAKTPSPPPPVSIRPRSRMLIIDDDAGMVRAYRRMLARYDAVVVSTGEDALELIRAGEQFHLILCDLMMPEMDGPQVYEAIAELEPRLVKRIVFCTGGAFTTRAREFIATIDNPVLDKPITIDVLERLLDPSRG